MNLKNNYLLRKLLKWANKNVRILIFTMLYCCTLEKEKTKQTKQNNNNNNTLRYLCFTPMYQKSRWYDLHFLRCRAWRTEIYCGSFFTLLPPKNPKNQNLEKTIKRVGDIIILHIWANNHNHMMYGSWDTEWDEQFFFILGHFCSFNNPENHSFEKRGKKRLRIILHKWTLNDDHMMVWWFLR